MTMWAYAAEGFEKHSTGHKKINRRVPVAVGTNVEWSLDKHNEAGLSIYGIRDKWL